MRSGASMQAMIRIAPAGRAGLDVDRENSLQALRPGHRGAAFGRCPLLRIRSRGWLASPAPLGRCHPRAVLAVGRKHTVESGQIHQRFGHQSYQGGMKSRGSKMTCVVPSRYGVFSSYRTLPLGVSDRRFSEMAGPLM